MIIRAPRQGNFTLIPNSTLRDARLSFRARGILAYILSMPDGWQSTVERITEQGIEGREAVRAAMKELEAVGYVRRTRRQIEGGRFTTDVEVFDSPVPGKPTPENPSSVPPAGTRESPGRTETQESVDRRAGHLEEDLPKKTSKEDTPPSPPSPVPQADLFDGVSAAPAAPAPKTRRTNIDRQLDAFMALYPHEKTKDTARAVKPKLNAATKRARPADILEGLKPWAEHWAKLPVEEERFIPKATTWLNEDRWTTSPPLRDFSKTRARENAPRNFQIVSHEENTDVAAACPSTATQVLPQSSLEAVRENLKLNRKRRARGLPPQTLEATQ